MYLDNLILLEKKSIITSQEIKSHCDGFGFAIDFYVQDAEKGARVDYGLIYDGIVNIDHHAPIQEMRRRISSATLARNYLKKNPTIKDARMFINHTDADSMLSVMMLRGIIPPERRFVDAAEAADHYGRANRIAEVLQAIDQLRDPEYSAAQLLRYLSGKGLDQRAQYELRKRKEDRRMVRQMVKEGMMQYHNDIAYITLDGRIDAALFLPHITAAAIVIATPGEEDRWKVSVRLGNLDDVALNELDLPNFGGRWNAGSTARSGGTKYNAEEYARIVYGKIHA